MKKELGFASNVAPLWMFMDGSATIFADLKYSIAPLGQSAESQRVV